MDALTLILHLTLHAATGRQSVKKLKSVLQKLLLIRMEIIELVAICFAMNCLLRQAYLYSSIFTIMHYLVDYKISIK